MKADNALELVPNTQRTSPKEANAIADVARLPRPETFPTTPKAAPRPTSLDDDGRNRSKRVAAIIVLALLLAAAVYGSAQWLLGPKVPAYVVVKSDILQTIVASGRIETPLRIDIGSQIIGTVAAVPVAEGQTVKAGQVLIALEDSEAKASVAAARAAVVQAETRLKQIRAVALPAAEQALRRTQANLLNSTRQLERLKELKERTLASQSQLDDAATAVEVAQSDVRAAQLQVDTNRLDGADYLVAQTALDQARANLISSIAKLKYATIQAQVDGTLIARNVERGDVVQPGKVLMVLSPTGPTQVVVQIDEKNLSYVSLGQAVLASADAYPEKQFAARVAYINPSVDADRGSVTVKLDVSSPPEYLRQDMTVSTEIEVAHHDDTLTVAVDAVHDNLGAAPWVLKAVDNKIQRQPVKIGARGAGKVEILQGLQAGDIVLASSSSTLSEGKRVRAQVTSSKPRAGS